MCVCVCVFVVVDDDELRVTVKYLKILNIAQQCFYGKIMSPATIQIIHTLFERSYFSRYFNSFYTLHKKLCWNKHMFVCSWPSLGLKFS